MLSILGEAEYGIYNIAFSIISYLSLLSLGFGASYIRFYSKYKREENQKSIAKLNGLFMIVFLGIGILTLVCGFALASNPRLFFNNTYSDRDVEIAHVLMLVLTFNMAWSFPSSLFTSYVTAHEQFIFQKSLNMIKTVVGPFLTLPVLLMGYGSIGMVAVTTSITVVVDFANLLFCCKKLNMRFDFKSPNWGLLSEIASFSIFIAINQIIDQINWATDKVILGKFCTSASVAVYAIGSQLSHYYNMFSTAISGVYVPQIHRIETSIDDEKEKNRKLTAVFISVGRLQFMVIMLILTGFAFFGKYFISRWAGSAYSNSYYVALLLMIPVTVPLIQNIGIEIQRAKNKHQFRSIVYLGMAVINVIISVFMAKAWGELGAALGTTISLILANGIVMNVFYHKVIKIDVVSFWKNILKFTPALIAPVAFGTFLMRLYSFHSLIDFGLLIIAYITIYIGSMYLWGMNKDEKAIISKTIKKVLKR